MAHEIIRSLVWIRNTKTAVKRVYLKESEFTLGVTLCGNISSLNDLYKLTRTIIFTLILIIPLFLGPLEKREKGNR